MPTDCSAPQRSNLRVPVRSYASIPSSHKPHSASQSMQHATGSESAAQEKHAREPAQQRSSHGSSCEATSIARIQRACAQTTAHSCFASRSYTRTCAKKG
eukprot:6195626-Pleurochrysis_carterae.AAC.3